MDRHENSNSILSKLLVLVMKPKTWARSVDDDRCAISIVQGLALLRENVQVDKNYQGGLRAAICPVTTVVPCAVR